MKPFLFGLQFNLFTVPQFVSNYGSDSDNSSTEGTFLSAQHQGVSSSQGNEYSKSILPAHPTVPPYHKLPVLNRGVIHQLVFKDHFITKVTSL